MIKEQFFPTSVYGFDVKLDNDKLAQDIINWSKQDKGIKKTNRNGWHSQTDMQTKPEYKPLVDQLFLSMQYVWKEEWLDREPVLGNMWANINPQGGSNQPHVHPNCLYTGVYYIKSNINSGRLKLYDPRPGIQLMMPVRKSGDPGKSLWRDVNLAPIEGRIIIFPAWLWHAVEPNQSNDIRISVSFNFIQQGFQ
jgi:uncharacterized protein (TIGR02466 family)